jgi:radical SAM superfamily enzyme YgiQ (UPF0313 family)
MKVLFTHSYFLRFDPKQWEIGHPYPPLGTLYAAALLRENDLGVALFDTMFCRRADEINSALENEQPDVLVIYDDGFNYLTKMCLTNMREAAFSMMALAKEKGCTVILCSSDSTDHYEQYLDAGADFVIRGEGEYTLLELIQNIKCKSNDLMSIQGLAFKLSDAYVKTAPRAVSRELDAMPMPAWDLVDIEPYRQSWMKHAGYFSLNMNTTRGCPYKCNWCAKPIYGNRYNVRSPQHVVKELKYLKEKFSFDHIWFCDDIFGLKPAWVAEFADLLAKENLEFRFKIQSRADLLVHDNYVNALTRAGCENVWIGAESGSQQILDAMDKGIKVEQVYEAVKLLKQNNIRPSLFIQFGYPGEMRKDIDLTIKMINDLLPYEIGISVSYPLPGTAFYEKVKQQLMLKANWTDSDEMALMFRNTYQPRFYKQLHRYVHRSYRKHLAIHYLSQLFSRPLQTNRLVFRKALSALYYGPATFIEKLKLNYLETL